MIRRITIAALAAFLMGAVLAVPAASASGPQAVAAKKAKKCKKKKSKSRKKGCKKGTGGGASSFSLPGQATPSSPTQPGSTSLHVMSLSLAANPVLATTSTTGQVTLDAAAPSGGQQVNLSSNSSRVSVPGSVVVTSGQNEASFAIHTTSGGPATATLTASIGASQRTADLNVVDTASVSSLKLERQCFTLGSFSSNRVSLDVPAPADTLVTLSSLPSGAFTMPSSVTIPQGSTSAFFSLDAVAESPSVTVTAALGSSQVTDDASVSATDPDPKTSSLVLNPTTIDEGGSATATVTLDCEAPSGGTQVDLLSSPSLPIPAHVTVPEDSRSLTFPIDASSAAPGSYTISATAGGGTPQTANLTVTELGA